MGLVMPLAEQRGGAELMLLHLLHANRNAPGTDYCVAFLEEGPMAEEVRALGYETDVIPAGRLRHTVQYAAAVRALAAWLQRTRVRAVLSWMGKAHLYAGPAAQWAAVPATWFQHGLPGDHWIDRLLAHLPAQAIYCCSQAVCDAQRTLPVHCPLHVIYPAVDLSRFDPARLPSVPEARQRLQLPPHRPVVGLVARLQRWKGVHVFIEAAARVHTVRPDAFFVVLGARHFSERTYADELREQVRTAGLEEVVHFAGHQRNVPEWMQAMDLLVHASISPEPFGMVLLEGMALGKAVIATRAGGPLEIIGEGEGVLTPPDDPAALAHAILALLNDEARRHRLGTAGRARATQFSAEHLAWSVARHLSAFAMEAR